MPEFGKLRFDGKTYRILGTFPLNRREAVKAAQGWRSRGYNVRVVGRGRGGKDYYLFGRKK